MDPEIDAIPPVQTNVDDRLATAARKAGKPVAAVEFAAACLVHTGYQPESVAGHLNASDFCRVFLESVMDRYLGETIGTLGDWKIQRSEDLGRIVYALIDEGLARPGDGDRFEDFDGVFNIEEQQFAWSPETINRELLRKEERESKVIFGIMAVLGALIGICCLIPAVEAEPGPRTMLIALGSAALLVPGSLYLLVSHGYRRVRKRSER